MDEEDYVSKELIKVDITPGEYVQYPI